MNERVIKRIELDQLKDVADFYERLSGVNPSNVDPKYGTAVDDARRAVAEQCKIAMVYQRVEIAEHSDESITLENGMKFSGKMPVKVIKDADELFAFVIVLEGYTALQTTDIMVEYFADTWGSAYAECAQAYFATEISELLRAEDKMRTHLWCPGQHSFELKNQQTIFDLLKPEDIGCTLTKRLMMVPVKACSGIMGIVPTGTTELPKPCDYCQFGKTCPASKRGCAAI